MSLQLLQLAILLLTGLIALIILWVSLREVIQKIRYSKEETRHAQIAEGLRSWLKSPQRVREKIESNLLKMASKTYLEEHYFTLWDQLFPNEQEVFRELYIRLGLEGYLKKKLQESPDPLTREKTVLKLAKVAGLKDTSLFLEAYHAPDEIESVKECCAAVLYQLMEVHGKEAPFQIENPGAWVSLLEVSNDALRSNMARMLASMPGAREAFFPYLISLSSDVAKKGALEVFQYWNEPQDAKIIYDYVDDANPDIRQQALSLLGKYRQPDETFILLKKITDPSEAVREAAVQALFFNHASVIEKQMVKRLEDPSEKIRARVFLYLAHHQSEKQLPRMIPSFNDPHFTQVLLKELRQLKMEVVEQILAFLGIDLNLFLKTYAWTMKDCFEVLLHDTAKHSISEALRQRAIELLPYLNTDRTYYVLKDISISDPNLKIRALAASKLGSFKLKKGASHER